MAGILVLFVRRDVGFGFQLRRYETPNRVLLIRGPDYRTVSLASEIGLHPVGRLFRRANATAKLQRSGAPRTHVLRAGPANRAIGSSPKCWRMIYSGGSTGESLRHDKAPPAQNQTVLRRTTDITRPPPAMPAL